MIAVPGKSSSDMLGPFELDTQHSGDCVECMRQLPDESVDLVVTSPPYLADKEYERIFTEEEHTELMRQTFEQVYRILKPSGTFALEIGFVRDKKYGTRVPFIFHLHPVLEEFGFQYTDEIPWVFPNGHTGYPGSGRLFSRHETIHLYAKDAGKQYRDLNSLRDIRMNKSKVKMSSHNGKPKSQNPYGKNPGNVWPEFPSGAFMDAMMMAVALIRAGGSGSRIDAYEGILRVLADAASDGLSSEIRCAVESSAEESRAVHEMFVSRLYPARSSGCLGWSPEWSNDFIDKAVKFTPEPDQSGPDTGDVTCGTEDPLRLWLHKHLDKIYDDDSSDAGSGIYKINVATGRWRWHNCPFPLELVDRVIRGFCPTDGVVLDPFGGSCMVGKGALLAGRRFLTFEIDLKPSEAEKLTEQGLPYYNTAVGREIDCLKRMISDWRPGYFYPDHDPLTCLSEDPRCRLHCRRLREGLTKKYLDECAHIVADMRKEGILPSGTVSKSGIKSDKMGLKIPSDA